VASGCGEASKKKGRAHEGNGRAEAQLAESG
jgi:hypothetical protein